MPSAPAGNNGLDNSEFNLIARVNDVLEAPETCYSVLDLLGQGTFGQVFRCQDHSSKDIVAIKVVKNKPAYRNQAMLEIQVAKQVRGRSSCIDFILWFCMWRVSSSSVYIKRECKFVCSPFLQRGSIHM